MSKRGLVVFSLVFLSMFLLSLNFISSASCSITTSCNAANTVMKLSSTTNAHGALYNQGSYGYYLCCDFTGDHTCSGSNKVLGLSATTNAHAQIPSYTSYSYSACFADLSCTATTSSSCPSQFPIAMVSLSSSTNAHLAQFSTYSQKICCKNDPAASCGDGVLDEGEQCDDGNFVSYDGCSASCKVESGCWNCVNSGEGSCCYSTCPQTAWTKSGQQGEYTGGTIVVGDQLIPHIYEDFCLGSDSSVDIGIYQGTLLRKSLVKTISGSVINGQITGTWVVSQADLNAIGTGNSDIIFEINNPRGSGTISSSAITVTVSSTVECGDGIRNGDEDCDGNDLGGATCASVLGAQYEGNLNCYSAGSNNECNYDTSGCTLIPGTCASLGYECGQVNGETCGTCSGTETCQAGQCVSTTQECAISSASWGAKTAIEGDSVQLNVQTSNCIGQQISFTVKENDGTGDDDVLYPPTSKQVTTNAVTQTWEAEYQDDTDGLQTNPPEYYFNAIIGSNTLKSSNLLEVSEYSQCAGINYCANYLTSTECGADICNVARNFESQEIQCGYGYECECDWNGQACVDSAIPWGSCNGDGVINVGEQCDGDDWGPVPKGTDAGCAYFGYEGGTLTCNNCVFDLSQCTDNDLIVGECNNGILNLGEQCDENVLSLKNCTSLDSFSAGDLYCNDYCLLDTRNCEGGEGDYDLSDGKCIWTDTSGDNCDDGMLNRNLVATWTGTDAKPTSCHDITDSYLCPAQIKVSYFTIVQFVVAVILLIIIYIIIKSRMNKKTHKAVKKSSKKKRK